MKSYLLYLDTNESDERKKAVLDLIGKEKYKQIDLHTYLFISDLTTGSIKSLIRKEIKGYDSFSIAKLKEYFNVLPRYKDWFEENIKDLDDTSGNLDMFPS